MQRRRHRRVDDTTCDAVQGVTCDPHGRMRRRLRRPRHQLHRLRLLPGRHHQYDCLRRRQPLRRRRRQHHRPAGHDHDHPRRQRSSPIMVPAGQRQGDQLPWVRELANGSGPTALVLDGAYRLRSTQPVTVYQFNPLNADVTNDASLLLPVNTWTGNYLVAAWQHWDALSLPRLLRGHRQRGRHHRHAQGAQAAASSTRPAAASRPTAPASSCSTRATCLQVDHRHRRRPHRHDRHRRQAGAGDRRPRVHLRPARHHRLRPPRGVACSRSRPSPRSTSSCRR